MVLTETMRPKKKRNKQIYLMIIMQSCTEFILEDSNLHDERNIWDSII